MNGSRPNTLTRLAFAAALGGLLVLPACLVRIGSGWDSSDVGGHSVRASDDRLTVDGTELPFSRWVDVTVADSAAAPLHLETATGPIDVTGSTAGVALQARLWSESEGDGHVELRGGELVATSDRDGVVFVNEIKGTVPLAAELAAESGTGTVSVAGLAQSPKLKANTGTSTLSVTGCDATLIDVGSGTGELLLKDCKATRIAVESGTGDVRLSGCDAETLEFDSGTGDVSMADCQARRIKGQTGTGDASLQACSLGSVHFESGTGDLVLRGGHCDSIDQDLGTGDLKLLENVSVGTR